MHELYGILEGDSAVEEEKVRERVSGVSGGTVGNFK